ncbi:MAG: thiamine pyrophosphate-binding protein [Rhizobiales bacterium]|nr:thiamine pyrophosphate-binding protein [Hyphomicrobiales bacterium]
MAAGTDYILDGLIREGIDHIFMVPGGLIDPFLPALGRFPQIRPIVATQEGGAAYMADGYARASGKFGVALGIGGPGLGNMVTAMATALTDSSRMMVLSGEVALAMEGLGQFQDASAETFNDPILAAPVTRFSTSVDSIANLNHLFRRALMEMAGPPSGPVHLSLPHEALVGEIAVAHEPIDRALWHSHAIDRAMALRALLPLADEKPARIAILAGAGVEHAGAAQRLVALAERFSIPVATTLRAKGVMPEDHPMALGVFGYAGTRHATQALLGSDLELLIVLGSGLNERDTMHWSTRLVPRLGLISVNLSPKVLAQETGAGHAVVGDAGAFIELMFEPQIVASLEAGRTDRAAWHAGIRSGPRLYDTENLDSTAVPIHPTRIVGALRKALPRDGILLVDSGAHRAFAGHYFDSYMPRTYISATNLGPMGWGIPASIGAACARPGTRVALVTGDGCMQMHGIDIAVAARYGLPVTFVVLNNSALGNVWLRAHKLGPVPAELTSIPDHDWASFARGLGLAAATVRDPDEIEPALALAMAEAGPFLIDFKTEKNCPTPVYDYSAEVQRWSYHE